MIVHRYAGRGNAAPPPPTYRDPWSICPHVPASPVLAGCHEHRMPGRHYWLTRMHPCRAAEIMSLLVIGAHRDAVARLRRAGRPTKQQEMRLRIAELEREVLRLRHEAGGAA